MEAIEKKFTFNDQEYAVVDFGGGVWTILNSEGKHLTTQQFSIKGLVEAAMAVKNDKG